MQYRVDHLENLKADALDLTIHPPLKIKGDVEPFEWHPEATIHIPEDGDVTMMPPNPAAFQVNNEIQVLLNQMEEMAGAPREAMGIRSPGEKTAFEVQSLQNAAGRIFQHKVNRFEIEFLEPILNTMLEFSKRNMDVAEVARTMDDDLGVADFISITKDDITARGKLRPIGARHYAARAQLIQNMMGLFNSPMGQMIAPHISAKRLAGMVEEYMGFEQYQFIKDNETKYIKLFKLDKTPVNYLNLQKFLIMKLYTVIPPRRLDYSDMTYITIKGFDVLSADDKMNNNYFVLSKSKKNQSIFWFGKLNTKSLDNSVQLGVSIIMGKSIEKTLLLLRTYNETMNLIVNKKMKQISKSTFSKLIQSIFIEYFDKKIGASLLRKIYISDFYKNDIALKTQIELSQKMNHSPTTASTHYRKVAQ